MREVGSYSENESELEDYLINPKQTNRTSAAVVSAQDVLLHINQATTRLLDEDDMAALEYIRTWGSRKTLGRMYEALVEQQQLINNMFVALYACLLV
jgi:hypothetical protein